MHHLKSPLSAQLEITQACPNVCTHCYNYYRYLETGKVLKVDDHHLGLYHFQQIIRLLINNGVFKLTFTGGEPFLRRDILYPLIVQAKESYRHVSVNTSGVPVRAKDAKQLKLLQVDSLLVSLISGDPCIHNSVTHTTSFDQTIKAIELLCSEDLDVTVNMVVSKLNKDTVRQTIDLLHRMGVKSFAATPVLACPLAQNHQDIRLSSEEIRKMMADLYDAQSLGMRIDVLEPLAHCLFSAEELAKYAGILTHRYCCAGITDMAVSTEGDTRPCVLSISNSGNLLTDGWESCWNGMSHWREPTILPELCQGCPAVDQCGGGCRISALSSTGEINAVDPYVTEPISDLSYLKILDQDVGVETVDRMDVFETDPKSLEREEEFGGIVYLSNSFTFLAQRGYSAFKHLQSQSFFGLRDLVDIGFDESLAKIFVSQLLKRKLIRRGAAGNG